MRRLIVFGLLCVACEEDEVLKQETAYERDLAFKLHACTGCHGTETPEAGLDLTDIWAQVDIPSAQMDMALIEPGNHLRSYLWHKVSGTQSIAGGLGQRMPVNQTWTEEDIDRLGQWIDLGLPK